MVELFDFEETGREGRTEFTYKSDLLMGAHFLSSLLIKGILVVDVVQQLERKDYEASRASKESVLSNGI